MTENLELPADLPALDGSRLEKEFGDSPEILAELRDLFLEHIPPLVAEIERAVAAGDSAALARHAHSLKGACSTYGAPRLTAVGRALEEAGKNGALGDAAGLLPQLARETELVGDELAAITPP